MGGLSQPKPQPLRYFRRIASDILFAPALADLTRRPELWNVFTARQKFQNTAHSETETIPLRGPATTENIADNFEAENYAIFLQLMSIADLVLELTNIIRAREIGRVMLVKLKPQKQIANHRDEGEYARYYTRLHFPLTSEPEVNFVCGDESVHMAPGELWWFNHQIHHSVINDSFKPRIHLILDVCAPGFNGAFSC